MLFLMPRSFRKGIYYQRYNLFCSFTRWSFFAGGFKGENKSRFAKRQAEELKEKAVVHEEPKNTTIEFAISTHTVLRTFSLFCHGLLAGLALWHTVVSYILLDFGDIDFIEHYRRLALPVQCVFYLLIALCALSSLDR